MIIENREKVNNIITDIRWRDETHISIKRYGGALETIQVSSQHPDVFKELDISKNFINNKTRKIQAVSIESIPTNGLNKMDIAELSDKSKYVYDGSKWIKIQKSIVELSESIRIPLYIKGKVYRKKSVIQHENKMYVSLTDTSSSPLSASGHWRFITEYNMFVNVCETVPLKLKGVFTVSDNNYKRLVFQPSSLVEYRQLFSGNMIPSSSNNYQYLNFSIPHNSVSFNGWRSGFPERLYSTVDDYVDNEVKRITGTLVIDTESIGSGEFKFIGWNRNLGGYQDEVAKTIEVEAKNNSLDFGVPIGAWGRVYFRMEDNSKTIDDQFSFSPSGIVEYDFDLDLSTPNGTTNLGIICKIDSNVNEQDSIFHSLKNLVIHREVIDNG